MSYLRFIAAETESGIARWRDEIERNSFAFSQWFEAARSFVAAEREAAPHLSPILSGYHSLPEAESRLLQEVWFGRERLRDTITEALRALQGRGDEDAPFEVIPLPSSQGVISPNEAESWFASELAPRSA